MFDFSVRLKQLRWLQKQGNPKVKAIVMVFSVLLMI